MRNFDTTAEEIMRHAVEIKDAMLTEIQGECAPVIFGAGNCGHKIYDLFQEYHIEVRAFCDNRLAGNIDQVTGLKIVSPEELRDAFAGSSILLCVDSEEDCHDITRQLQQLGVDISRLRRMHRYFYWKTEQYFAANRERYRKVYGLLEDELSRQVYLKKLEKTFLLRSMGGGNVISPAAEEYFDEKAALTDQEVFIDCGGYDGDTSVSFIKHCRGKYKDIVIFEPESCKKEKIAENMGKHPYTLYQYGVWSGHEKLSFSALGTAASQISEHGTGGSVIETVSLDETVYDRRPTYIKMDIEGAEQEALKGAAKIIRDYRPKLAVCIYHKPGDMFEIPEMVKALNPDYRLYVRQYTDAWYDTVLYAL